MKKITDETTGRRKRDVTDPLGSLDPEALWAQLGIDVAGPEGHRKGEKDRVSPPVPGQSAGARVREVKARKDDLNGRPQEHSSLPPPWRAASPEDTGPVISAPVPVSDVPTPAGGGEASAKPDLVDIFREVETVSDNPPQKKAVEDRREDLRRFSLGGFLKKKEVSTEAGEVDKVDATPPPAQDPAEKAGSPEPSNPSPSPRPGRRIGGALRGVVTRIRDRFAPPPKEIASMSFEPGPLSQPSFEGELREVCLTYAVDAPYQFVHIEFSPKEGALVYSVVEPGLSPDEKEAMDLIEKAFGKMIVSNAQIITPAAREAYLRDRYLTIIRIFDLRLADEQRERIFFHLKRKYLGYARLDALMKDRYIEDISCNGPGMYLYILHRIYGSIRTNVMYDEVELNNFVLRLAQMAGRHISLLQPIRDLSLPDGNRANITLGSEVTKKGSTYTIRKFRSNPISPVELVEYGTIDPAQLAYLWILMEYKRSILVSGGTATGKTTLLNVLCSFIPPEFKIVSIEDTAELNLMHPNWIQSVSRSGFGGESSTSSLSGVSGISSRTPGDISLYDLLVAALRQRPEFIIVGEVRGTEAFTLFQAIAVGHAALGTIHAGSMDELLARVESNPMNVPRTLLANLDAVIFAMYLKRGDRNVRRITNIVEVLELDRETKEIVTNTAFKWVPETDTYQFQGRSFLFDKIRETYGVDQDLLTQELVDRANFISWMQRHGIREYGEVTELVRTYYRDKKEVEKLMNSEISEKLGIGSD